LHARQRAEAELQLINEQLENRVAERTTELSAANALLTSEVAERTMAQVALGQSLEESRREREKLDGILHSVTDGMVLADSNLTILHMNAAAEKLLGVSLDKVLGQPLARLVGGTTLPVRTRELLATACAAEPFDFEVPGNDPQHPLVYQCRITQMASDLERPGIILTIQDVTRERELDRMKNAFLGMAAHELNTPLAAILGFTEILITPDLEAQLSDEQRLESLALVHGKALELSRLIDDLLDISRVEAGQPLVLDYEAVPLDQLLHEVLLPYREKHPRHTFELLLATPALEISADRGRLRQVLTNLVSNAVKYSPQGGAIRVTVADDVAGRCQLTVADQGIGMTAEQVAHIFDRFYRVDASNTAVKGVGLGMSIVRNIVLAHGGDIHVQSQPGVGTTVHVSLPVRAAQQSPAT
jgi:PAS domain S-box-containing protein